MRDRSPQDPSQASYHDSNVIEYYGAQTEVQECEKHIFATHLRPGMRILEIGVGGGRLTPILASGAKEYVGIDYSEGMVQLCRKKHPERVFHVMDASSMPEFQDASFDAVVFGFNGIDALHPDDKRLACLRECARILKPGGIFIFSCHNASQLIVRPVLRGVGPAKLAWRIVRAVFKTLQLSPRMLRSDAFWKGEGYVLDPVHGGILLHFTTPERVDRELIALGFTALSVIGSLFPLRASSYSTPWHYYAYVRS